MSKIQGVEINYEQSRIEWNPHDLEDNIFFILGSIAKGMKFKLIGDIYEIGEHQCAVNFMRTYT